MVPHIILQINCEQYTLFSMKSKSIIQQTPQELDLRMRDGTNKAYLEKHAGFMHLSQFFMREKHK